MRTDPHRSAVDRWLRLEAAAGEVRPELDSEGLRAVESSLAAALRGLPDLGPSAGFARRVLRALEPVPHVPIPRLLPWWARAAVTASLLLAGSAWLDARARGGAWAAWLADAVRPGELIDAAGFALREGALFFVRGLSTWQVFAELSETLLRVLTTPDAAAIASVSALAAFLAFLALRGVLASDSNRSVYRV